MKKPIVNNQGKNAYVGEMLLNRLIPDTAANSVGPFLLLDHLYPKKYCGSDSARHQLNTHPHRGIITFTYVLNGEVEHFDSLGNHTAVTEGGAHWMKAGKGILHDERPGINIMQKGGLLHAIQFWVNLPALQKGEEPAYKKLNSENFPLVELPDHAGQIKILLGGLGLYQSPVESSFGAYLYHITLNAKSTYTFDARPGNACGVFVPREPVIANESQAEQSNLLIFDNDGGEIVLRNPGIEQASVFVLGGQITEENIVVHGPFVMNTEEEIALAYREFFEGKYGTITE